jgi:hypothetical protein
MGFIYLRMPRRCYDNGMNTVTASNAPIVAATRFTKTYRTPKASVQIWNWSTGEYLSEFPTVFDGQRREAISPDGRFYVAANWRKGTNGGVACYDAKSGEKIWHRPDLGQVQRIRFSARCDRVWCSIESRPAHCLNAMNGSLLSKQKNVSEVIESPYSEAVLHNSRQADYLLVERTIKAIPRLTPSMSDASFSSDSLCLAEYSGPVRCFDCETGEERWRYVPPPGYHVIALSLQSEQSFYGFLFGFDGNSEGAILRFSRDGKHTEICRHHLQKLYGSFGDGVFITDFGEVLSLTNGKAVRSLAFPEKLDGRPVSPEREGLRRHGYAPEQIEEWRKREHKAGRIPVLDDFYRPRHICVKCRGYGKTVLGVLWRDEQGVEQSAIGDVPSLIKEHDLDSPKNWLTEVLKWNYLNETCTSCDGKYLLLR